MDKQIFVLAHPRARQNAAQAVLAAAEGMRVEIKPRTRSSDQNAKLHALFSDISRQAKWGGRRLSPIQWKTLFISGHSAATGHGAEMVPGLENEFVNIRESSSAMSVARMASLIEYVIAWCANNDVQVTE